MEKPRWVPHTWLGIGKLSGLSIVNCRTLETDNRHQIIVQYHVAPMQFPDPMKMNWCHAFKVGEQEPPPNFAPFTCTAFEPQMMEIIVDTRFRYGVTEDYEKFVARTIFQLWSLQSGHADWERGNRLEEWNRVRNLDYS